MRWKGRRGSDNIEDRRSTRGVVMAGGGGGLLLVIAIITFLLGGDPRALLQLAQQAPQQQPGQQQPGQQQPGQQQPGQQQPGPIDPNDEAAQFVSVVLADTEDVWTELFRQRGRAYREPKLVLFRDKVSSACGFQSAATGPFYCPLDQRVYIDLGFFQEMKDKLNAPGDFAQAYVIAHEVGHHVQQLLGISEEVHAKRKRVGKEMANRLSVRMELQADFFAGVWAHHAQQKWNVLEEGDIEEALRAANQIGDDRLQMQAQGYVVPESFTHGRSEQRVRWFVRGLKTGDLEQGDTFSVPFSQL